MLISLYMLFLCFMLLPHSLSLSLSPLYQFCSSLLIHWRQLLTITLFCIGVIGVSSLTFILVTCSLVTAFLTIRRTGYKWYYACLKLVNTYFDGYLFLQLCVLVKKLLYTDIIFYQQVLRCEFILSQNISYVVQTYNLYFIIKLEAFFNY